MRIRGDTRQRRRIAAVAILLGVLGFAPILLRLYWLMVTRYDSFSELALKNQTRATPFTAQRGTIYDTNMNILACSQSVEDIYLNPRELKQSGADLEEISRELGEILEVEASWIETQGKDLTKRYKRIASKVDKELAGVVRSYINEKHISGIHLEPNTKRYYPYGSLAAQVIGFTNDSNQGSEGVEASYNSYLEGKAGNVITTKGNNEMDMPFSYESYLAAQSGCSVILTLDTTVQQCLESRMQEAIDRYQVQNGAFGLVMEVKTGKILAMATLGSYDPNDYQSIADPKTALELERKRTAYLLQPQGTEAYEKGKLDYLQALSTARLKQWRNRCISDGYEPGSTFKVMTMAAALDCGAIDLNTSFYCRGSEQIPGRAQLLHCWRSTGHGGEQTPQALQNSCNIAFAHIALKLGGERFYDYVQRFGVLEKTGIDLAGESKGVFFDKALVTDTEKWGTASLTSGSFGQTFKLTPLQLVRGISAVVNGGMLLEPYIVEEVLDAKGNTVLRQEPTVLRQVISQETSRTMCTLLESVVTEGTAKNANVYGFQVGGKTGTSEKIDVFDENGQRVQDKIVSFVGIAPMDDPQYIVLVALDTPSRSTGIYISGGVMAAPTVGAVLGDILPYLDVTRSYEENDEAGKTVILEDMVGLRAGEAQEKLKAQGLEGKLIGTEENVTGQIPAAGEMVSGKSQVILYLGQQPEAVSVPSFLGLTRSQAEELAEKTGLAVLPKGNRDTTSDIKVIAQSIPEGTKCTFGQTVELEFADVRVGD